METYADVMEEGMTTFQENGVIQKLEDLSISTQYWNESVYAFRAAAKAFDEMAAKQVENDSAALKVTNDQKRGFEKNFLLAEGLPDRIQYRHVITAPSLFDAYGGSAFPGIGDLLYKFDQTQENSEENKLVLKQIKKHVSDLMVIIKRAANYLKPIRPSGTRSDATTGSSSAMMLLATILINYLYSF